MRSCEMTLLLGYEKLGVYHLGSGKRLGYLRWSLVEGILMVGVPGVTIGLRVGSQAHNERC